MGLRGRLEDMSLVDILQIVGFSQKTGCLQLKTPEGNGEIVFRRGNVVCAYSWSTLSYLKRMGPEVVAEGKGDAVIREQLETSLRDLARLHEGEFYFELAPDLSGSLAGVDISAFLALDGINPQHLLLDLSREMDEQRRDAASMLESMFDANSDQFDLLDDADLEADLLTEESEPTPNPDFVARDCGVVVVDDDPAFLGALVLEIRGKGFTVLDASGPVEGERRVMAAREEGDVIAVVDQRMPNSSGRNFKGGFELIRRLNKRNVPVLLMADGLTEQDRRRALDLGIRKVVYKPTLSQLDPEEYDADFRTFVDAVIQRLEELADATSSVATTERTTPEKTEPVVADAPTRAGPSDQVEFLAAMTEKLLERDRSIDISRAVLAVGAKFLDRGILFLIEKNRASGLGAFGLAPSEKESFALARNIRLVVKDVEPFATVQKSRRSQRVELPSESLERRLLKVIERKRANEIVLIPMLHNGEVLLILYGDNGHRAQTLGGLRELELFVAQAGMALENAFMQRRIESLDAKFSAKV